MKILLTGATGYLGSKIGHALLARGHHLVALHLNHSEQFAGQSEESANISRCYLSDERIEDIMSRYCPDGVIHTSTRYGRSNESIATMIEANVVFPAKVLTSAIGCGTRFFINTDSILERNVSPYALTKSQFLDWLAISSRKIKTISLKLDHFFGPRDKPNKFIAWVIEQLQNGVARLPLTAGTQTRDFIYVDDVVNAFMCVLEHENVLTLGDIHTFEVGTGVRTQVRHVVMRLKELLGSTTELGFGDIPFRENEMLNYEVDSAQLRALGWRPEVMVDEGLKRCVAELL